MVCPMLVAAMALCVIGAWAQRQGGDPHVGYVYPAGGQQGTTVQVLAGGQNLRGARAVHITDEGVHASVIEYIRPLRPNERGIAGRHIRLLVQQRAAEERARREGGQPPDPAQIEAKRAELDPVPDHPWLRDLDRMSLAELADLLARVFDQKAQPNSQIAESVLIEVSIDPDAPPGDRELRVITPMGMANPVVFQVGTLPEVAEQEPNDPAPRPLEQLVQRPEQPPLDLPVTVNGQIMPGDVDHFDFTARRGQRLVIQAYARHLVPYLADAVPGWFQATVALLDASGHELAYVDDYRFDPDPVMFYEIPADGRYRLEIRDAIYRGREDFVYRVAIGEQPFITWMFPLGGPEGQETVAAVGGWNLPFAEVSLNTAPGGDGIRQATWPCGDGISNQLLYAVDTLPECVEAEPNDGADQAQGVELPQIINGRIGEPGDQDVFEFEGRAGDRVVAEVAARRLRSPLDSVLHLTDASGAVVAWNDDFMEKDGHLHTGPGLLTHHADSYLMASLPADGVYRVRLADAQGQGGEACAYRLRLAPAQPDFALRVTPASLLIPAGRSAAVCVHALRRDGFTGSIEVTATDLPGGFTVQGGRIPAGRDSVRMTLTAPAQPLEEPVAVRLEGSAVIDRQEVTHPAQACEDMMQAFLWRHLVPAQELLVAVTGGRPFAPTFARDADTPVAIPLGGTARVPVRAGGRRPPAENVRIELSDPPEGISLQDVTVGPGEVTVVLRADESALEVGYEDNLIAEISVEMSGKRRDGTDTTWTVPLGALPAIPFEIVAQ